MFDSLLVNRTHPSALGFEIGGRTSHGYEISGYCCGLPGTPDGKRIPCWWDEEEGHWWFAADLYVPPTVVPRNWEIFPQWIFDFERRWIGTDIWMNRTPIYVAVTLELVTPEANMFRFLAGVNNREQFIGVGGVWETMEEADAFVASAGVDQFEAGELPSGTLELIRNGVYLYSHEDALNFLLCLRRDVPFVEWESHHVSAW